MSTETEIVTVRRDDLELLRKVCACYAPYPPTDDISEAMARTLAALSEPAADQPAAVPPGRYGRIEIPGYRENEGWITEETRFGLQVAVVRDRDGAETAQVGMGPLCRVVWLPVPGQGPDEVLAIGYDDSDDDEPLTWRD